MSDPARFIGIDVAKAHLDIASPQTDQTWQVPNTAEGHQALRETPHPDRPGVSGVGSQRRL